MLKNGGEIGEVLDEVLSDEKSGGWSSVVFM
jgi:hypothetical protein